MNAAERERRGHIRHWAVFMIMHLEGRDGEMPRYTYAESLERLRELIDRELGQSGVRTEEAVRTLRAG